MDQQNFIFIGGLTIAIVISVYLLWGPSPFKKKKKGDIVGLANLGATCFLNTLLQSLASCLLFVEWLDQQACEERPLTSALRKVLWILNGQTDSSIHAPNSILIELKRQGWFLPAGEQDAHELFHCIISSIQEENKKERKNGSLSDALPVSDTLSQTSDILDDPFEGVQEDTLPIPGSGDEPLDISYKTQYEDANSSLLSDNDSPSLEGQDFYSIDSGGTLKDTSDETLKFHSPNKTNLTKQSMEKLRSSRESIRRGIFERTGIPSPPSYTSDFPPFQGLLASSLQCYVCGNSSSVRTDTFDSLSLSLGEPRPMHHTLPDLLRQFVRTEIIPDVDCEKCGKKTHALKTYNFGKLPPCLCLHISRTAWHTNSGTSTKRHDYVEFPEYLVMDPFTWRPGPSPPSPPPATAAKHLYRLKSVVVHMGSVHSGHFLTFRRGPLETTDRHKWFMASDEVVELSSLKRAMDSLAYMLFYEKCTSNIISALTYENMVPQSSN